MVENIRAYLEETLETRTRRVEIRLLSPWDPDRYDWTCHPNPFSKEWITSQTSAFEANDPLHACIEMTGMDKIRVLKSDASLPYACPGVVPFRGVGDVKGMSVLYVSNRTDCSDWQWNPHLYDSYIIEAYLKGDDPIEVIVEWCPLGLVEQSDLEKRIIYAVNLTRYFNSSGRGVKLAILPGYTLGSRHMDPLYWSSGASYYSSLERASGISDRITWQVYIVKKRPFYEGFEAVRIPFLYGGWIHTYKNRIPQSIISPGVSLEKAFEALASTSIEEIIVKLLENLLTDSLPLEAREVLFHFNLLVENGCTDAVRFILPSVLKPVYTKLGSGLEFLPEIRFYQLDECEAYNLESGRRIYPCDKHLRYEALVRYMNRLKEKIVEAEELFCS